MVLTLQPFTIENRRFIEKLWQFYKHDMSEFTGSMPDDAGLFKPGRLPGYFDSSDALGYVLEEDDRPVGFASVFRLQSDPRVVGGFFILRGARRRHLGAFAASELLSKHPGRWTITFQSVNQGAGHFWRGVARRVVGNSWTEETRPVPGRPDVPWDVWLQLNNQVQDPRQ
jgi:predicted acetyltransferase